MTKTVDTSTILTKLADDICTQYTKYETGKRTSDEANDCISDYVAEAKRALYEAMKMVIGESEDDRYEDKMGRTVQDYDVAVEKETRNELRTVQLARLDKAFGIEPPNKKVDT